MNSDPTQISPTDDPASAFAELRGEISLLRRAVEGLTAERQNAPDYTPTLKALASRVGQIEGSLERVAQSPSMRLTPESLAKSIAKASETARASDRETIGKATGALRASIASINAVVEQAWTADRQWKQLLWTGGGGLLLGALGIIAGWHLMS